MSRNPGPLAAPVVPPVVVASPGPLLGPNQLVRLRTPDTGAELATRVESATGAQLTVAAPLGHIPGADMAGILGDFLRGETSDAVPLAVTWPSTRGECRVPAVLTAVERRPVRLWRLDLAGGAFRCRFAAELPGVGGLATGMPLVLTFDLDGSRCEATGTLHSLSPDRERKTVDVVVVFDEPVGCARELRRFVLQTQIREPRARQR